MYNIHRIQEEAKSRLRKKKFLERVFFLVIFVPAILMGFILEFNSLKFDLDLDLILVWFLIYIGLGLIYWKNWRCPSCEVSLSNLMQKGFPPVTRACRHCGFILFPEIQIVNGSHHRKNFKMRPKFFVSLMIISAFVIFIGHTLNNDEISISGFGMFFLTTGVLILSHFSKINYCKACQSVTQEGKYCEHCGVKK